MGPGVLRGGETLACRSSYGCPDSRAEKHKREPEVYVGPACGLPPGGAILGLRQRWGQSKVEGQQVCEGEQDWRGAWSRLSSGQHPQRSPGSGSSWWLPFHGSQASPCRSSEETLGLAPAGRTGLFSAVSPQLLLSDSWASALSSS